MFHNISNTPLMAPDVGLDDGPRSGLSHKLSQSVVMKLFDWETIKLSTSSRIMFLWFVFLLYSRISNLLLTGST